MRLPDWPDRLTKLIEDNMHEPHVWGTHDCVMWAAAGIEAVTGDDLGLGKRGTYDTEAGAARMLVKEGVKDVAELADKYLGDRVHIAQARTGDVVVRYLPTGEPALGVCYGSKSLFVGVAGDQDGLVVSDTLDLDHCHWV